MRQTVSPTVLTLAACLLISLMEATDFPRLESTHLLSRSEVVSPTLFEMYLQMNLAVHQTISLEET